ncbi:hypothetical protein chiPu_0019703, partial [Chiloscyllium punctatum]|nr:hypothetical protein [Chiloscyllium punctatum]
LGGRRCQEPVSGGRLFLGHRSLTVSGAMSARSRRQLEPGLEPPAAFSGRHHEAEGLIPPSHFEVRCPGPPAVNTDPWAALSKATKDILELRRENERLRELQSASNRDMPRGRAGGEMDKVCSRARVSELEEELRQSREKGQREAAHFREKLEAVTQERDTLQEDLRKTKLESESQNSVITQLRTYIGQLVPDEKQLEESRQEKEQLNNKVQHLEKEREALKVTAELMNIRLRSLNDILTIQESESSRKPKQGVLEGENVKRLPLVTRWREKVFTLMVQLKSQEISHANDINQLHVKLANLEEGLRVKEQEQALLLHSFEDRTAEMNMERVQNQTLREELASAQSDTVRFQGNAERAENTLCHFKEVVSSFYQRFLEQETEQRKALCRLGNLGQRVTFANKRIDTIHGLLARKDAILRLQLQEKRGGAGSDTGRRSHEDLEKELEMLNRERDQLAAELKKTSQLIEKKVTEARLKCDSELKDHLVVRGQLEEALEERTQCQQRLTEELRECQKELADSQGATESLRIELTQQQQKYEQALAGKVEEAEQRLAEQLSEMEKQLNEARRGHTKAAFSAVQSKFTRMIPVWEGLSYGQRLNRSGV